MGETKAWCQLRKAKPESRLRRYLYPSSIRFTVMRFPLINLHISRARAFPARQHVRQAKISLRIHQGPVFQSVVSLTSSLVVKMLTILVSTISNSQVFLPKNVSSICKCKSYSHFFSKNISVYAIFNDQSFNDTLTNDIVSFEQQGPG